MHTGKIKCFCTIRHACLHAHELDIHVIHAYIDLGEKILRIVEVPQRGAGVICFLCYKVIEETLSVALERFPIHSRGIRMDFCDILAMGECIGGKDTAHLVGNKPCKTLSM